MQRFSAWEQKIAPDFWRERFRPKDLLRVTSHANSVLSMRHDARLMERFDINVIPEHSVGSTYVWIPVQFDEPTYLGDDELYPWEYDIDERWLYVDAIYDKHVDPDYSYQNKIDFVLSKGKIRFVTKLPDLVLYISKGRFAEYRIYNEIGCLLDYKRLDSVTYRDTIEPILAAFYLGPTPRNLLAFLNVVFGLPVVKYGDETVLSTAGNIVETDKYTYPMYNATISVKEGDVLYKFQPLSNSVELITHKTHPYWWEDRVVDLFAKYKVDGPMDNATRDYIMRNFLYDAVAYVRLNMQWQDLQAFSQNLDILDLFYDALPTRTDIFMGQTYYTESWDAFDGIMTPNMDSLGVRLGMASMYGFTNINDEMFIYAPSLGRPIFTNTQSDPLALTLDNYYWHIFDPEETDNWREFWKSEPKQAPYFEPNYDRVYLRLTETPRYDHKEYHLESYGVPAEISDMGIKLDLSGDTAGGIFSELELDIEDKDPVYLAVQGETICGILEMDSWEFDNVTTAKDGIVVFDGEKGTAITQAFPLGNIPKNVFVRTEYDLPEGTLIDIRYSQDKKTWNEIPDVLESLTGYIYFKITMYASEQKTPTFRRLYLNLTMIESSDE